MRGDTFILLLTDSQRTALMDLITEHMHCPDGNRLQEYLDNATNPPTRTTMGELMRLVNAARVERRD